jgi:hypothetical protein
MSARAARDSPRRRARRAGLNESGLVCGDDDLDSVAQVQLGENSRYVCLDGCLAEEEFVSDFRVGESSCDGSCDFEFSLGQFGERSGARVACAGAGDEFLQKASCQRRCE